MYNQLYDTGGQVKRSVWLDKPLRKIEALLYRDDFQNDLTQLRTGLMEEGLAGKILDLARKYKLPPESATIIYDYLRTGELSATKDSTPLVIICDADQTCGPTDDKNDAEYRYVVQRGFPRHGVELFIPPGSSPSEIKSFIDDNWKYIESKIGRPTHERRSRRAERDAEVLRLANTGKYSHAEIAIMIDENPKYSETDKTFTYSDVAIILNRKRDIKK